MTIRPYVDLYNASPQQHFPPYIFIYCPFELAPTQARPHVHVTGIQLLGFFPPPAEVFQPAVAPRSRLMNRAAHHQQFAVNQMIRIPRELPLDRAVPGPVT